MSSDLRIKQEPGYLRLEFTGEQTLERLTALAQEILEQTAARGCFKVLLDARASQGGLSTVEKFELATYAERLRPGSVKVAILDTRQSRADRFLEMVASNRAIGLRLFFDESEALAWLAQASRQANGGQA